MDSMIHESHTSGTKVSNQSSLVAQRTRHWDRGFTVYRVRSRDWTKEDRRRKDRIIETVILPLTRFRLEYHPNSSRPVTETIGTIHSYLTLFSGTGPFSTSTYNPTDRSFVKKQQQFVRLDNNTHGITFYVSVSYRYIPPQLRSSRTGLGN